MDCVFDEIVRDKCNSAMFDESRRAAPGKCINFNSNSHM